VRDVLLIVDRWQSEGVGEIYLYYNDKQSGSTYDPSSLRLIPADMSIIEASAKDDWPSRCIPIFRADFDSMLSHLLKQYLFTSVYRAIAESLASENASRLASMQAAEKNVEERLGELRSQYNHRRQSAITSELLDMVAGYEALKDDDEDSEDADEDLLRE
jgi:F-type H+-transporting ATPase subunit gamma